MIYNNLPVDESRMAIAISAM